MNTEQYTYTCNKCVVGDLRSYELKGTVYDFTVDSACNFAYNSYRKNRNWIRRDTPYMDENFTWDLHIKFPQNLWNLMWKSKCFVNSPFKNTCVNRRYKKYNKKYLKIIIKIYDVRPEMNIKIKNIEMKKKWT